MDFLGTFAVRKGAWSGYTDLLYLNVGNDKSNTVSLPRGGTRELAQAELDLGQHWFVPYYVDIGTGELDLTWQVAAGIGYAFRWGDIVLDYRHLDYRNSDGFVQRFNLSGGRLGVIFRF